MPPVMISSFKYFTNSVGKLYLSVIMGLFMVLVEVGMHDHQYSVVSTYTYLWVIILLATTIYLYRKQIAVNDKQYLEGMIEHHSVALQTSVEILEKTDDYNIAKLAKNIIQTQTDEIREMEDLIRKK
jgi:Na+/melibiose symporter-like transporter